MVLGWPSVILTPMAPSCVALSLSLLHVMVSKSMRAGLAGANPNVVKAGAAAWVQPD